MKIAHSGYGRIWSSCFVLLAALAGGVAARAQSANLVIADFESGKAETAAGLAMPVLADEQFGGNSGGDLSIVRPGAQGSGHALRVTFKIADGFVTPFTSVWAMLGNEGLATDLSAYKGLRFYVRSPGGSFAAGIGRYVTGRSTRHVVPIEVKPEWTLVELPFEKFAATSPGGRPGASPNELAPFAPTSVTSIGFNVSPQSRGQFELEIDQLEAYK